MLNDGYVHHSQNITDQGKLKRPFTKEFFIVSLHTSGGKKENIDNRMVNEGIYGLK